MKKKLLLGMSTIALVAAASVGTTMAVLSNQTPVAENTMTVGNVKIAQNEYERVDKTKHFTSYAKTGDLKEFTQNQVILSVALFVGILETHFKRKIFWKSVFSQQIFKEK